MNQYNGMMKNTAQVFLRCRTTASSWSSSICKDGNESMQTTSRLKRLSREEVFQDMQYEICRIEMYPLKPKPPGSSKTSNGRNSRGGRSRGDICWCYTWSDFGIFWYVHGDLLNQEYICTCIKLDVRIYWTSYVVFFLVELHRSQVDLFYFGIKNGWD